MTEQLLMQTRMVAALSMPLHGAVRQSSIGLMQASLAPMAKEVWDINETRMGMGRHSEVRRLKAKTLTLRGGGGMDEWLPPAFKRLPLITRWFISFQCFLFLLGHVVPDHPFLGANGGAIHRLGLYPVQMLQPFYRPGKRRGDEVATLILQSYRALTHVLVHATLPHLLFNMFSFSGVGQRLERLVGSVGLLQLIVGLALVKSAILVSCEALFLFASRQSRLSGPLVGFSGVIFGLLTIDSLLADPSAKVSIYGMQVSARVMPVALLGVQWVLFPFASVWGHAAGEM
jgi:membrane associated rhomboid family serine protease